MKVERRYVEDLELRAVNDGESRKVSGYFAVYDQFSPVYGRFREKIDPGFFSGRLGKDDVRALFNHNSDAILGRTSAGTLTLRSDEKGLWGEIDPVPQTRTGEEVIVNVGLRNLTGGSFAFSLPPEGGDKWEKGSDGAWERTLLEAGGFHDVSVVTDPFYPQTEVGLREIRSSMEESFNRWAEAHPEEVEPPKEWTADEERLRLIEL